MCHGQSWGTMGCHGTEILHGFDTPLIFGTISHGIWSLRGHGNPGECYPMGVPWSRPREHYSMSAEVQSRTSLSHIFFRSGI